MIFTTYSDELVVKDTRTKGYRDLAAATTNSAPDGRRTHEVRYQFDGRQYLVADESY